MTRKRHVRFGGGTVEKRNSCGSPLYLPYHKLTFEGGKPRFAIVDTVSHTFVRSARYHGIGNWTVYTTFSDKRYNGNATSAA